MADDPKTGTLTAEGGDAAAVAPTAGTPPGGGRGAGVAETAEQKAARLEKELADERALRLSQQEKVEAANRERREAEERARATPPTTGARDPIDSEYENAIAALNRSDEHRSDPAYRAAADYWAQRKAQRDAQRMIEQAEPQFKRIEDEKVREKARQIWLQSRGSLSVETAEATARGMLTDPNEITRLRNENAELLKDRQAREAPKVSLGGTPPVSGTPPRAGGPRQIKMSEYAAIMDDPSRSDDEKRALLRDEKAGALVQVPD